jgi:predicted SnoaL-like aldol condensation-catalyzing enzyme
MNGQLDANKRIVREFCELAINQGRPEDAVKRYIGPYYRQHNPQAGDGPEPFIQVVRGFAGAFPQLQVTIKRQVAEGDLVVQHSHFVRQPGDRGMAVIDIFRLENGKIVEHWDVLQGSPGNRRKHQYDVLESTRGRARGSLIPYLENGLTTKERPFRARSFL